MNDRPSQRLIQLAERLSLPLPVPDEVARLTHLIFEQETGEQYPFSVNDLAYDERAFFHLLAEGRRTLDIQEGSLVDHEAHQFFHASEWSKALLFKFTTSIKVSLEYERVSVA